MGCYTGLWVLWFVIGGSHVNEKSKVQQQIPCGDDNKKGRSNGRCKSRSFDSLRSLRMTPLFRFDLWSPKVKAATGAAFTSMLG
jgi:hypothetical protein